MQAPEQLLAEMEARARRIETPCGEGTMVWRVWGEGPALVLGHGGQGAWSHWIRNIDALAAHYRVIAGGGHWVMYERAEAFNAALLDMLASPARLNCAVSGP